MTELLPMLLVAGGAFLAGAMNALAGGGTFFSFPALLAAGVPPITANASNTVALWPASLSSAWAYRQELARHRQWAIALTLVAFCGGIGGGLLLLATSNAAFAQMIPWLLLVATALFAFSSQVGRLVQRIKGWLGQQTEKRNPGGPGGLLFQFIVAVYGGFFGAGQGILTLAALSIQGVTHIQELNALKNWIAAVTYTVSALTFIIAGAISWPHTLVMLITATLGGYAGARLAQRLPAVWLKRLVIGVGASLTLIYFYRTYAS
ncbi:MAG: sulfite exporter TauE/SafE family protein [Azovibrio sp.]|nr:sulfite exporter TauE/SafE family protein [Azovibrio sp.]